MNNLSGHSKRTPILGCVADDITGATDLAINLQQGGMRVVQILGVPDAELLSRTDDVDAFVVALKTRSVPRDQAVTESLDALRSLVQYGVSRFYFKYCSTFDSTDAGNIGPVAEAFLRELGVQQTIFCPAFPRAGRTVYRGHLFVGHKLLNESGMENHPLNPMQDANLVRVLSKQSSGKVGLLGYETIQDSSAACDARLASLRNEQISLVIADTCDDEQLATLAQSTSALPLVTGGSGLARYLPQAYRQARILQSKAFVPSLPNVGGRGLILAGSCSIATNAQVNWMQQRCPTWPVDVAAVMANAADELDRLRSWAFAAEKDRDLLVSSTQTPASVAELQSRYSAPVLASAIEQFLADVAQLLVDELDIHRLVLAGGETSGAIVGRLGVRTLRIGPEICPGVPWTETIGCEPRLALALKSGNFGSEDFFSTALEMLP